MELTPALNAQCIRIVDSLVRLPSSAIFQEPVDPVRDNCPDYAALITSPQDLSTIRRRLVNRQYKMYAEWERDMNLIWSNAQYYNGADPVIGRLAAVLAKHFEKMSLSISPHYGSWLQKFDRLFRRLNRLVANPPPRIAPMIGHSEFHSAITTKDLAKLAKGAAGLTHRNDIVQFVQLLTALNIPFALDDSSVRIRVGNVSPFAARPMLAFLKEKAQQPKRIGPYG
jgi:hypothetical protein